MKILRRGHGGWRLFVGLAILAGLLGRPALGQVPGLPTAAAAKASSPAAKGSGATNGSSQPAAEKAKPAVASPTGPITVHQQVSDQTIERFLSKFLPKSPGVETFHVSVDEGVVTLTGRVDSDDTRSELTDVVKRVEGVRLVLNQTVTDEEVMTGWEFARQEAANFFGDLSRKWILILISLAIVAISWLLRRHSRSTPRRCWPRSCITCCCGRWSARSSAASSFSVDWSWPWRRCG
jgi:osmotically-inducible protein OsmY